MNPTSMNRSGLAARQDIGTPVHRALLSLLQEEQTYFLSYEKLFRSPDYLWPRDALHNWSRIWEYPYAFHHLRQRLGQADIAIPTIIDVGSGVTFFPFALARRLAADIVCTDIDPIAEKDLLRAARCVPHGPGMVSFRRTDGVSLPFDDSSVDAAYCISVLEHLTQPDRMVAEIARILRPSGLFVLTIDVAIQGEAEIQPLPHAALVERITGLFNFVAPDLTVHPASLLTSENSTYPLGPSKALFRARQLLKIPLRRKWKTFPCLGVQGFVLAKI